MPLTPQEMRTSLCYTKASHPKKRLSDRTVADDLLVRRIRIQRLPEIDVFLLMTGYAREQQPGRANGQGVEMLPVFCPLPCALVLKVWIDELRCLTEPAPVRKMEGRRIRSQPLSDWQRPAIT